MIKSKMHTKVFEGNEKMENCKEETYPNVLVFSNNCFSKSKSNGRTLANFFIGWPKDKLAQFYIQNEMPDSPVCDNYFKVTDGQALRSIVKRIEINGSVSINKSNKESSNKRVNKKNAKRTPFTCLVRDFIWDTRKWRNNNFNRWIDEFSPELILIQAGDSSFMLKLATDIAKERNIPLVIYNSEDYYFKNENYFTDSKMPFIYSIFRYRLKKQFDKTMNYTSYCIYNTETLRNTYYSRFKDNSDIIMTNTALEGNIERKSNEILKISYLGNLGIGRHKSLIDIANAVGQVNASIKVNVYGKIPNDSVQKDFNACKFIEYKGLVSYEEVVKVMKSSDLLIHTENFSEFYKNDLKHAFSTKIADCLGSGTCLMLYAPENLACTQYLIENKAAYVITENDNLEESIKYILENDDLRKKYAETGLIIAKENHNLDKNREKFRCIIAKVVEEWKVKNENITS